MGHPAMWAALMDTRRFAAASRTGPDAPPDLFPAIEEQLGLKLEPARGQVPVLVVDKIAMPTEN